MVARGGVLATSTFRGIAFPYRKGVTSFPEQATDADLIKQSIVEILLTERGERVMRPTFGSGLTSRVFENNSEILESQLQAEVHSAIGKWEPRVLVQGVEVLREDNMVTITLSFVIAATLQQDSLSLQLSTPK